MYINSDIAFKATYENLFACFMFMTLKILCKKVVPSYVDVADIASDALIVKSDQHCVTSGSEFKVSLDRTLVNS